MRLVASAIAYQISMAPDMARKKDLSMAWMYVLTCKKTVDWNMDKFVLYLIGSVTKAAVANDPEELFGLVDVVTNLYKVAAYCNRYCLQYGFRHCSKRGRTLLAGRSHGSLRKLLLHSSHQAY